MKKFLAHSVVAFALVLVGCQEMPTAFDSNSESFSLHATVGGSDLSVGLHNNGKSLGELEVTNDAENLYISFSLPDGLITSVDLHVASTPAGLPQNKSNNPTIGHFDHKYPAVLSETFTATIPILDEYVNTTADGQEVVIALHASVVIDGREEGIWAGTARFRGDQKGGNWATYFTYVLEEEEVDCVLEGLGWIGDIGTEATNGGGNGTGHHYLTLDGVTGFDGTYPLGAYGSLEIAGDVMTVTASAGFYVHQVWYLNDSSSQIGNYGSYEKVNSIDLDQVVLTDIPIEESYLYLRVQFAEMTCE